MLCTTLIVVQMTTVLVQSIDTADFVSVTPPPTLFCTSHKTNTIAKIKSYFPAAGRSIAQTLNMKTSIINNCRSTKRNTPRDTFHQIRLLLGVEIEPNSKRPNARKDKEPFYWAI